MKTPFLLVALCALLPSLARSQTLFSQNFGSSSTLSTYVGSGAGQFDAISVGGTSTASIAGGALSLTKSSSNTASFSRTTDLTTSSALLLQFDFSISGNTSAQTISTAQSGSTAVSFYLGSGLAATTSGETNGSVTARFNIGWTSTSGEWNLITPSGATSANQTGSQTVSWYVNNGSSSITYLGPNSSTYTVAAGAYDLWIGSTRSFAGTTVVTTGLAATDFKFRWGSGAGNATMTFDNISASAIPEPSTYAAIFGGIVLVGAVIHRRRRQKKPIDKQSDSALAGRL